MSSGEFARVHKGGQRVVHLLEIRDPPLKVRPALFSQPTGRIAAVRATGVKMKQFIYLVQGEPQLLGALDEPQQANGRGRVVAIAAWGARWFSQKAAALVVAQRLVVHAGSIRQLSGSHDSIVNPVLNYEVNPRGESPPAAYADRSLSRFHCAVAELLWCTPTSLAGNHHLIARPTVVRRHQHSASQPHSRLRGLCTRWIRVRLTVFSLGR